MQPAQRHLLLLRHAKSAWPNGVPEPTTPIGQAGPPRRGRGRVLAARARPATRRRGLLPGRTGSTNPGRWSRPNSTIPRPLPTTTPVAQAVRPMLAAGQRPGPRRASGLALWAKRAEGPSRRGTLPPGQRCRPWCPGLCPPPARHLRPGDAGIGVAEGRPWKQPFRPVRPGVWHPCHQLAVLQRREPRHTSASARVLLPWPRA